MQESLSFFTASAKEMIVLGSVFFDMIHLPFYRVGLGRHTGQVVPRLRPGPLVGSYPTSRVRLPHLSYINLTTALGTLNPNRCWRSVFCNYGLLKVAESAFVTNLQRDTRKRKPAAVPPHLPRR